MEAILSSTPEAMKSRWVKQLIHRELDMLRESYLGIAHDVAVDLDIDFEMAAVQQASVVAESEQEAAKIKTDLKP